VGGDSAASHPRRGFRADTVFGPAATPAIARPGATTETPPDVRASLASAATPDSDAIGNNMFAVGAGSAPAGSGREGEDLNVPELDQLWREEASEPEAAPVGPPAHRRRHI